MRRVRRIPPHGLGPAAALALLLAAPQALAQGQALVPKLAGKELALALEQGGYTILLRHAATDDYVPEPGSLDYARCETQRNLSEQGRAQARNMARAFTALGIHFDRILSSPYCRCVDTAKLAFGRVETLELLSVGDELSYEEKDARGRKIRELLNQQPSAGKNSVLITHTGNLLYAFGLQGRPEGIAHVFRPSAFGPATYMGRMLAEEWPEVAELETGDS